MGKIKEIMLDETSAQQLAGEVAVNSVISFMKRNVDISTEMTRAIEAQRVFDACSQALKQMDSINQRAASEIGKIG